MDITNDILLCMCTVFDMWTKHQLRNCLLFPSGMMASFGPTRIL